MNSTTETPEFTLFDRHANMPSEMLDDILNLIRDIEYFQATNKVDSYSIINYLYGLFDGYLYKELPIEAKRLLSKGLSNEIIKIYNTCESYPKK